MHDKRFERFDEYKTKTAWSYDFAQTNKSFAKGRVMDEVDVENLDGGFHERKSRFL